MSIILTVLGIVVFVVGMLVSIALHELGHMYPAKKFGMKVTQYFVGFGRTLWSVKRGETEYGVKAIPLGGYVRIIGMMPPARGDDPTKVRKANTGPFQSLIENARHAEYERVGPDDGDRLFYRHAWWKKLIVMASGPLVNVVIAFVLFAGLFMAFGIQVSTTTVNSISDCVISAAEANPGRTCQPGDKESPAKKAGFQSGDKIVSFNGTHITAWDQLSTLIRANGDKNATIVVERDGKPVTLTATTMINKVEDDQNPGEYLSVGFLGVTPVRVWERQGIGFTLDRMGFLTVQSVKAIASFPEKLVNVAQSIAGGQRDENGPMSIVGASRVAGEVVSTDELSVRAKLWVFISLLASVNLFVALFNFIPLLPLDGGHMAGAIWEGLRRGFARLFGRPDPGYVDTAKLLPVAYVAASVIVAMGVLLIVADVVNPIRLFNG